MIYNYIREGFWSVKRKKYKNLKFFFTFGQIECIVNFIVIKDREID